LYWATVKGYDDSETLYAIKHYIGWLVESKRLEGNEFLWRFLGGAAGDARKTLAYNYVRSLFAALCNGDGALLARLLRRPEIEESGVFAPTVFQIVVNYGWELELEKLRGLLGTLFRDFDTANEALNALEHSIRMDQGAAWRDLVRQRRSDRVEEFICASCGRGVYEAVVIRECGHQRMSVVHNREECLRMARCGLCSRWDGRVVQERHGGRDIAENLVQFDTKAGRRSKQKKRKGRIAITTG
jgi:hypothetical protein